jgi:8-oxo-dGTP pyrophosphatase MutT (NUDIX family)
MESGEVVTGDEESRGLRTQYGCLCYRVERGQLQILLITSRDTGRWLIPKGWPMRGREPAETAAAEAWEEAGAKGVVSPEVVGLFTYQKLSDDGAATPCAVAVYAMGVTNLKDNYPENRERRRKWFPVEMAAQKASDAELAELIRGFQPPGLASAAN